MVLHLHQHNIGYTADGECVTVWASVLNVSFWHSGCWDCGALWL